MKKVTLFVLIFSVLFFQPLNASSKRGLLIWFYTFETKNEEDGYIYSLYQTAGASFSENKIHKIAPLTPQSKISQTEDGNYFLNLKHNKLQLKKNKPLFLGQILDVSMSETLFKLLPSKYNILVSELNYAKEFEKYLVDRTDLQIRHQDVIAVRDKLLKKAPGILDYIIAVDEFVDNQLEYKEPKRPNTAVDLLKTDRGWCGEYTKLKQALLMSAGIPTRDVYASKYSTQGLSVDDTGDAEVHAWLQSYIPNVGWISIPSTKKLDNNYQFVELIGDYYVRALDLYKDKEDIQTVKYSNQIKRVGGVRGNGIFLEIEPKYFEEIQNISNQILDYDKNPNNNILVQINDLPKKVRPLMYWFLIASYDQNLAEQSVKKFLDSLSSAPTLNLQLFYINSSNLVKDRINKALKNI